MLASLNQQSGGTPRVEGTVQAPRQYAPREIVDHRVQVHVASVKQADDRCIDVPRFVRLRGPDPHARLCRMDAEAGTAPPSHPYQPIPGGRRGDHLAHTLSEQGEPPGGDVAVVGRGDHGADRRDLLRGKALRRQGRARGSVLQFAALGRTLPSAKARRGEADCLEHAAKAHYTTRSIDGTEEPPLVAPVRYAEAGQVGLQDPQECEEDSHHGGESVHALLQSRDANPQYGCRRIQSRRRDDISR